MAERIACHGRRVIHSSMEAKGRTMAVPSRVSPPGVLSGILRSSTTQRPPAERAAAPWAMTFAQSGTCVRAYVDRIASTSVGKSKPAASACTRLILLQPFVSIRSWAWASIASVRSTPTIRPPGPITSSISGKFRPVPHAMSITLSPAKAERLYGPEALCPLGVAGRGIEPGGDVVVLRLLAVCLDQVLSRTVHLAHGVLLDLGSVAVEARAPLSRTPRLPA